MTDTITLALEEIERRVVRGTFPATMQSRAARDIQEHGARAVDRWLNQLAPSVTREAPAAPSNTKIRTPTTQRIAAEVNAAELEHALNQDRIGYMTRAVVLATLPHSKPSGLEFQRKNGDFTLLMSVPNALHQDTGIALPYGPIPRLIFLWLTTEIKRRQERQIALGMTRSEFMRKVGLEPRTGKRGNMVMFEQQLKNLLGTVFTAWRKTGTEEKGGLRLHQRLIATDADLWWDHPGADCGATLNVDAEFFKELLQGGVPVDLNVVSKFKNNSLALDLYTWLTYRMSTLTYKLDYPWEWILQQFGSDWQDTPDGHKEFRKHFKATLKRVLEEYPEAHVRPIRGGLELLPSPPHVRRLHQ